MKKTTLNPFLRSVIFLLLFSIQMLPLIASSDKGFIKKQLNLLGFTIMKMNSLNGGYYQLTLSSFTPKGPLTLKSYFKPFVVNVKVQSGMLWLQKSIIRKNQFIIHKTKLPGSIILMDFILPAAKNVPQKHISAGDPVLRRMNIYHNSVKKYCRDVPSKIRRIRQQASRADRVVSDCNPSDDSGLDLGGIDYSLQPIFVQPSELLPSDYSIVLTSCDTYLKNAEKALKNAQYSYEYILGILKVVNEIKAWVDERCGDGCCIEESHKNSLKDQLLGLLRSAEAKEPQFDRFRNDITRFIEEYKECLRK